MCCNVGLSWWIPRSAFPKRLGTVIGWVFATEVSELHHKIWLIERSPVLYSVTKHLEAKVGEVGEVLPEEKCRNSRIYAYCISGQRQIYTKFLWKLQRRSYMCLLHFRAQPGAISFFEFPGYVEMVDGHKWQYSCSKCNTRLQISETELKVCLFCRVAYLWWQLITLHQKKAPPFCSRLLIRLL